MPPKPPNKKTQIGLGAGHTESSEMKRVRDSARGDAVTTQSRPRVRDTLRREEGEEAAPTSAPTRNTMSWGAEPPTGMHPKGASSQRTRAAVTVDEVGTAAVKLARNSRRESAPRLVASRAVIAKAPIDTRAAFVLSLIDGRNTIDALVDMSGMPEDEVKAILSRLARLGLITLP